MKFSLAHKLTLSILCVCVLCLAVALVATRHYFQVYFVEYINQQELPRLRAVAGRLVDHYTSEGNWQALEQSDRTWLRIVFNTGEEFDRRRPRGEGPPGRRGERGNRSPPGPGGNHTPMALLNQTRIYVSGAPHLANSEHVIEFPIELDGQIIGYLLTEKRTQILESVDQQFAASLNRAIIYALGLILIASVPLSFWAARSIVGPIRKLSENTRNLTRGKYDTRFYTDRNDEIGHLAQSFNELASTLEANQHSQQRWIADISHELRTPLAILKGELQAIEDGIRKFDEASLKSLISETERFSRLVNDLYDLSRAEAGDLSYQKSPLDLTVLLEDACFQFENRFSKAGLKLEFQPGQDPVVAELDRVRIEQLLTNLLENSLRYTDAGGKTQVRCERQSNQILVSIADSAPGVPPEALGRLFDRLYRVEGSRSRQYGGGGLGLAMCRTIVAAHEGEIKALPSDLGGLEIQIRLPCVNT